VNPSDIATLDQAARRLRFDVVQMSHRAGTPHLASALSCLDVLTVLYWKILRIDPKKPADVLRDRCILSKGHAASALYAALAERGFFPKSEIENFGKHGAALAEQPAPNCAPGVELATGSLGHGLPVGTGMALAARLQKHAYRVFVVMSDGECNEGTVWEAAMFAAAQKLNNLTVVVDYNKWQATGRSNEVMALSPLADKWRAFGWDALELDGHDIPAVLAALTLPPAADRPRAIVANTVKGKGVSFMEDDNNWHYRTPTPEEVEKARVELKIDNV
jgi:transketolase